MSEIITFHPKVLSMTTSRAFGKTKAKTLVVGVQGYGNGDPQPGKPGCE